LLIFGKQNKNLMIKPAFKIGIVLTLILVLPSLFFSAYEIGNLSQNEVVIDSIYSSQLESILYSVNQYSDDVMSGWAHQMDKEGGYKEVLNKNYSIEAIAIFEQEKINIYPKEKIPADSLNMLSGSLQSAFQTNLKKIENLQKYIKSGYQKIEVISTADPNYSVCAFAQKKDSLGVNTVFMLLDTDRFMQENLGPKIQGIAQDRFYISVFKGQDEQEIYSNVIQDDVEKNIRQKREFWLFPEYKIGIQMIGNTVEDLVHKRTRTNVILLIVMDIILLLGAWFVYRNIRQQMRLTQLKSDFISNVSHEIRTPLSLINMYSETLEMGRVPTEEKKKEYYRVINTEADRLSKMVNKMLNFNKLDSGRREFHFTAFNLNDEVSAVLNNYQQQLDKNGFELEVILGDELPKVSADRDAVSEAIINLIENAVKYSDETKKIEVESLQRGEYVAINIRDKGIGIAAKDQKMVFDKFYRVSTGDLAYKAKGSGIGLSMVKQIMEAHKGSVELSSKPGEGSCFTLLFPIVKE
jgi:two-component system phosphate regulon sensor histidine kinase PhoR